MTRLLLLEKKKRDGKLPEDEEKFLQKLQKNKCK